MLPTTKLPKSCLVPGFMVPAGSDNQGGTIVSMVVVSAGTAHQITVFDCSSSTAAAYSVQ